MTAAVKTLQEYQIYGGTSTWNHRLHRGVLCHPSFHTSTYHPPQEGVHASSLPVTFPWLSLSLRGCNGHFTVPVNVTAPCTFTSMTSLRQPDQRQNEVVQEHDTILPITRAKLRLQRLASNQTNQYKYTFDPKKCSRQSTISDYFCISYRMA